MNYKILATFSRLFLIVVTLQCTFSGCRSIKSQSNDTNNRTTPLVQKLDTNNIKIVLLANLIDSLSYYHGKSIQTTGLFLHNECSRTLYAAMPFERNGSLTLAIKPLPGLGMDFSPGEQIEQLSRDNSKLITLQGVIDTSGCRSSQYGARLKNARLVISKYSAQNL